VNIVLIQSTPFHHSLRSLHLVKDMLFRSWWPLLNLPHHFPFICHQYTLLLRRVIVDVLGEALNDLFVTSEKDHRGEVFVRAPIPFLLLRRSLAIPSIDLLVINAELKLIYTSGRSLCIIPKSHSTYSGWLFESDHSVIWMSELSITSTLGCFLRFCVLERSQPHVLFLISLVLPIDEFLRPPYISLHPTQLEDTFRISIYFRSNDDVPLLVIELNSIQADIVEVTMGGI